MAGYQKINVDKNSNSQDKLLKMLYKTSFGRRIVNILVRPWVSNMVGCFMDSPLSIPVIKPFIQHNSIDMSDYQPVRFKSFNAFFTRKIIKGKRVFQEESDILSAPCDSKLSVYRIDKESEFVVKGTKYTMHSLLKDGRLAKHYQGGYLMIFRLSVDDYHRYAYVDDGVTTGIRRINGIFHTVNPIANEVYPIYKENTREYSILKSKHFGNILMMEVGALMVGRIVNYHSAGNVCRGQEKGRFEYGGSTVILAFTKGSVDVDQEILSNSADGYETIVKMGQAIGNRHVSEESE